MRFIKLSAVALLFGLTTALLSSPAHAQNNGGPHGQYLVALSDLRDARAVLARSTTKPLVAQNQNKAISEIDLAMAEVKKAAIDDHRNPGDQPAIDANLKDADRFQKAQELLEKAHHDIDAADHQPDTKDLKEQAVAHINAAWYAVKAANTASMR